MASTVDLETLTGFGAEADAALAKVVKAVMQANNWSVTGHARFRPGPTGYKLHIKEPLYVVSAVVASGGITAAPDADTLGQGDAVLRYRNGAALTDGPTVKVYSDAGVAIPEDTRIVIAPDGSDYILVFAWYCPPA